MKKILSAITLFLLLQPVLAQSLKQYDVVIYGATSAGIVSAIELSRSGKSVVILNPDAHVGGLTTGGLGYTDIGNKRVIGGISREFYQRIKKYYEDEANWKFQKMSSFRSSEQSSQTKEGQDAMWIFEPSAATAVFNALIKENQIIIFNNEAVDLKKGVKKKNGRIQYLRTVTGKQFSAKMFIDATYEGDLMAVAKVSYTYGREAGSEYNETLNGVQTKMATKHQFPDGIDPYVIPGDKKSGLLPNVNASVAAEFSADKRIQAYCYRMCLTNAPENRVAITKPANYNEQEYELLFRYIDLVGPEKANALFKFSRMPNKKTDSNNNGPFSLDYIGKNYAYPEGDYEQRKKILKEHFEYQTGLLWTLQNHPRVPESVRMFYSKWGLPKDEFTANGNWTPQLYVREARRMVSDYVMTEHHCMQKGVSAEQPVGMGAYTMDSHHVQRHVDRNGFVKNEGDVQVRGFDPYPIDYRSIIPKRKECTNLLVPVCLSSTHMAFGSIRMEPVFMILGQSAAVAASMAIDANLNVQDLDYSNLRAALLKRNTILEYK